jgi:predicted signal transduction protein with EAL and GGDEF domain
VDASIITRLFDPADNEVIVRSLVGLVRALGIRSVAEGVETAEVAAALAAMGCDAAQGWCFSRPLDPVAATRWLARNQPVAAAYGPAAPAVLRPNARQPAGEHAASSPVPPATSVAGD